MLDVALCQYEQMLDYCACKYARWIVFCLTDLILLCVKLPKLFCILLQWENWECSSHWYKAVCAAIQWGKLFSKVAIESGTFQNKFWDSAGSFVMHLIWYENSCLYVTNENSSWLKIGVCSCIKKYGGMKQTKFIESQSLLNSPVLKVQGSIFLRHFNYLFMCDRFLLLFGIFLGTKPNSFRPLSWVFSLKYLDHEQNLLP
jgi:hypothetical protein